MYETPTGSGQGSNVVLNFAWRTWRDPASLLTSATQEELGRAGEKSSWGGGEGGEGSAGVAGEADGFEIGHFGCTVRCGVADGSLKEGDAVGGFWRKILG